MSVLLLDGYWYASKLAISLLARRHCVGKPHTTPDGKAVMVYDRGGLTTRAGGSPITLVDALVPQGDHGHDLVGLPEGGDRVQRIEFSPFELPDLERLAEYDHLPDGRKNHDVYPAGSKLA